MGFEVMKSIFGSRRQKQPSTPFEAPSTLAAQKDDKSAHSEFMGTPSNSENTRYIVSKNISSVAAPDILEAVAAIEAAGQPASSSPSLYDTCAFASESERLETLRSFELLDTAAESRFDVITELVASIFDVPVCVVSLVDANRGWFKSNYGPFQGCVAREGSFCSYILVPDYAEVLIVEDATKDARFSENPFVVGPPDLRYYAGVPLVTSTGHRIGTLCVCDFRPRRIPATGYNLLCNFAEIIVREIEKDVVLQRLEKGFSGLLPKLDMSGVHDVTKAVTTTDCSDTGDTAMLECAGKGKDYCRRLPTVPTAWEPVVMLNTAAHTWPIVFANQAWASLVGVDEGKNVANKSFWDFFEITNDTLTTLDRLRGRVDQGSHATSTFMLKPLNNNDNSNIKSFTFEFWLASRDQFKNAVPLSIPGHIDCLERENVPAIDLASLWIGTVRPEMDSSYNSISRKSSAASFLDNSSVGCRSSIEFSPRMTPTPRQPNKPARLTELRLGPLLGQGSYGRVYRGSLGEKAVAIKVLEIPNELSGHFNSIGTNDDLLNRMSSESGRDSVFINSGSSSVSSEKAEAAVLEAALSKYLAHPNIVPTIDYLVKQSAESVLGTISNEIWIIQHLCDKGTLYDSLDRGLFRQKLSLTAPPSIPTILETARDIASALKYLHEQDLVHGDLSGNNVLLSSTMNPRGFRAMVSDFGLSRVLTNNIQTQTLGSVTHMPPEMMMEGILTKSTDVYAFGVLLWEMWSGRRAWAGAAVGQVIFQVTVKNKLLEMPEDTPENIKDLALSCMNRDYSARPTCAQIVDLLDAMLHESEREPTTCKTKNK